ncbi:hypothetical protein [Salinicola endophyticus]|uniref:Uncharacterized protein n=1 Tax=Salinicola endophyticus TaxID=1949083 RepID=A0AB74U9L8_9GAMM
MTRSTRYNQARRRRPARRHCGLCGQPRGTMCFDPGEPYCCHCMSRRRAEGVGQ